MNGGNKMTQCMELDKKLALLFDKYLEPLAKKFGCEAYVEHCVVGLIWWNEKYRYNLNFFVRWKDLKCVFELIIQERKPYGREEKRILLDNLSIEEVEEIVANRMEEFYKQACQEKI